MEGMMALTDLVPWGRNLTEWVPWGRNRSLATQRYADDGDPFTALHREVNRMFDNFARDFGIGLPSRFGMWGGWPNVEVSETDAEVKVVAELPGLEQKDVEVSFHDGMLTLKGEKKSESNGAVYSERWQGQFQRSLQLGPDIDPDKIAASFKNGVLTVTLPKRPEPGQTDPDHQRLIAGTQPRPDGSAVLHPRSPVRAVCLARAAL